MGRGKHTHGSSEDDVIVVACDFCGGEFEWTLNSGDWAECPDCGELTAIETGRIDDEA